MRINEEVVKKYTNLINVHEWGFVGNFEADPGDKILCVGSTGDIYPQILKESGFSVLAIDLRSPPDDLPTHYDWVKGDFCGMDDFHHAHLNSFDHFICLDAIQYFGMGNYGEGPFCDAYDVIAMRKAYEALKVGGTAYVSFPVCKNFVNYPMHWRTYDLYSVSARLIQDFEYCGCGFYCSNPVVVSGRARIAGEIISVTEASEYADEHVPLVFCFMRLKKVKVSRTASDRQLSYRLPPDTGHLYNHDRNIIVTEWTPQPGDVCIDIGAGPGTWSLSALACGAKVVAFEPTSSRVQMLAHATVFNGFSNITIVPVALSDREGVSKFNDNKIAEDGFQSIPLTTLDGYWEKNGSDRLDYVNMDVEGHELQVIRGGRKTLARFKPKVIVEVHTMFDVSFQQVEDELRLCGYEKFRQTPEFLIADA